MTLFYEQFQSSSKVPLFDKIYHKDIFHSIMAADFEYFLRVTRKAVFFTYYF